MSKELNVVNTAAIAQQDMNMVNEAVERTIARCQQNRLEINRLVFDCMASLTETEDTQRNLSEKRGLKRFVGSISGSNKELQDAINKNVVIAQYASQQMLQRLAEQNLLTFDLIAAVNNKLNASVNRLGEDIHEIGQAVQEEFQYLYDGLGKFFRHNRNELVNIRGDIASLKRNVNLLHWKEVIEYQEFDGTEYQDLDVVAKLVVLVRDFYSLTNGSWSTADLLLLKSAMNDIGLSPKTPVNYYDSIKSIAQREELRNTLLHGIIVEAVDEPNYLISLSTLRKINSLEHEERYIIDTVYDEIVKYSVPTERGALVDSLTKNYLRQEAGVNLDTDVAVYDLALDLLYNLQQAMSDATLVEPIQESAASAVDDAALKEAEQLFLDYKLDEALEAFKVLAEAGNGRAMYFLGEYYANALGPITASDENRKIGKQWREKGAQCGDVLAALNVAYSLPDDDPKRDDIFQESFAPVLELAEKDDVFAQDEIASLYLYGRGVVEDVKKAASWAEKSAEAGVWWAACKLGNIYSDEDGSLLNDEKAVQWYHKAAEKGYAPAQNRLGVMYEKGQGVTLHKSRAVEWYRKAAEQGHAEAQYHLGDMYYHGYDGIAHNDKKAVEWYRKAAEQGYAAAQNRLGDIYFRLADGDHSIARVLLGKSNRKFDQYDEQAAQWYRKAAEQGYAEAQKQLGFMYQEGRGIAQDDEKAAQWYRKAAEQGQAEAQWGLGFEYIGKDDEQAVQWLQKAADQGHENAQLLLRDNRYFGSRKTMEKP